MLHENGEDAKLLAGGHSLLPLMKLRLAAPTLLVDLRRIPGLHGIQRENGGWRIGAMTRHADLQDTPELGVVARGRVADRRPAGAQPRHDRRLAGARRPGVGPARRAARARGRGQRARAERRAHDRGGGPVPGLPHHLARARRGDHRGAPAGARGLRLRLREVHPPRRGLGDGRRLRARQAGPPTAPARTCASA